MGVRPRRAIFKYSYAVEMGSPTTIPPDSLTDSYPTLSAPSSHDAGASHPDSLPGRLDGAFVSSVAWSAAAKWTAQIASWASTIVVARLLSASDYGIMGMATLFIGIVSLLSEMGVGSSVLVLRDLTEEQIAQLNTVALMMGVGACLLTFLMAAPLGAFFRSDELPMVMRVLGLTFIAGAFRSVPLALLQRRLKFRRTAAIEAVANLASTITVICLAALGFGYWALVLGSMAMITASALMLSYSSPHRFAFPRIAALRRAMSFSNRVVVGRISWYTYSNADFLVAGRILGSSALGIYTFGWSLTNLAVDKIVTLVNSVTPAFFSAMQDDTTGLKRILLGVSEVLALIVIPATVGAALVAPDMVPAVFGSKWGPAVPVIQLLAFYSVLRTLFPVLSNVLLNAGEERFLMWTSVASALGFPLAFLFGSRFGPAGIAAMWSLIFPFCLAALYWRVFRLGIASPRECLNAVLPALQATAIMLCCVLVTQHLMLDQAPVVLRLLVSIVVGAFSYLTTLWVAHKERSLRILRLVKKARAH